jgi:hypothetical protein
MKHALAIMLLIIVVPAVSAQEGGGGTPDKAVCGLDASQAPVMGGLRLGMTAQQVLALFPGSGEAPEVRASLAKAPSALGVSSFIISPDMFSSKDKFAGIGQITFTFFDGRVSSFSIGYNGPEWPHVDKFVAKVVEGTSLPAVDAWEAYAGMETQLKVLTCTDFEVRVFVGGQRGNLNYVLMSDLEAARALKERRAKAREKAKQASKP